MKLLGLIGGTSYHSTIEYYRKINEEAGKIIGNNANPPLLLYSINLELMRSQDFDRINSEYLKIAQKLESVGAEAIVICANTPHLTYDFVQPKIDIPILHIAEAIGKEAQSKNLSTLGLLGTMPTMTKNFISNTLKELYHIDTIVPEGIYLDKTHDYIADELTKGIFSEDAKSFYIDEMERLKNRGAEGIILGCTELPMLLKKDDFDLPMLSTTDLHVMMAVDFILGE